jgi:7-cyano-7-deazaguanine tRNA-ribosyltransferase
MRFELKDRDANGRIAKLHTNHGTITTPTLLPVINPNKIVISPKEMKERFDVEMIITNSYIISKHESLKEKALEHGVHTLVDFDGPIMTDSGTFQAYVYGKIKMQPLEIIQFQKDIGVDIGTILDVFGTPDQTKEEATEGMNETIKRARISIEQKGNMGIALPVQGSIYPDLRMKCAQKLAQLDGDLYPIGGVVPLMENQQYTELTRIILASKKGLHPGKPVHLFGAGHPLIFPLAVALGCDIFDSSAYIKYAQEERLIFSNGTQHLKDLEEASCCCPICTQYHISELKKAKKEERTRLLAEHNLYVSMMEIKKIRNAIRMGRLWELVEQKAAENPQLYNALTVLESDEEKKYLEQFEPVHKKKGMFYTGTHTIHRPNIFRIHNRLKNWFDFPHKTIIVFPEAAKPYNITYKDQIKKIFNITSDVNILIDSAIGPVPLFLDEMYPFAQSEFPEHIDQATHIYNQKLLQALTKGKKVLFWKKDQPLKHLKKTAGVFTDYDFDNARIKAIATMQFGKNTPDVLFHGTIELVKSKKTEKIRNVYCNQKHIVSMRAEDGMFTLKLAGGIRLHKKYPSPRFRIIVHDDAVSFIKDGKSVFNKFVLDGDILLRAYDECIIVDKNDQFLGVGRCLLHVSEMKSFSYGQAVKVREHIPNE